jgi:hypothetical protein
MKKEFVGSMNNIEKSEKFNKLKKLAKVIRAQYEEETRCDTLEGYCGLASYRLMKAAEYNGLYPTFVHGRYCGGEYDHSHAWLEYCGKVIDITATQFEVWNKVHVVIKPTKDYIGLQRTSKGYKAKDIIYWCYEFVDKQFYKRARIKL